MACQRCLPFAVVYVKASARMGRRFETHHIDLPLPAAGDLEAIARGKHLVARNGCDGCHGADLAGGIMVDDPAIGSIRGPNLDDRPRRTRCKLRDRRTGPHRTARRQTGWLARAHAIGRLLHANRSCALGHQAKHCSVPAVDAEVPRSSFGPIGKVLVALGKFPLAAEHQTAAAEHASRPPETADTYWPGAAILAALCVTCHRADFAGGPIASGPPDYRHRELHGARDGLGDWTMMTSSELITSYVSQRWLTSPRADDRAATRSPIHAAHRAASAL